MAWERLTGWPLLGSLAALLLVLGGHTIWRTQSTLNELRRVIDDAYSAELGFERTIGFGGLMHHFKNAVLRPENPAYAVAAREAADRALVLVEDLERAGESMGLVTDWTENRAMVEAYAARLDQVEALTKTGSTPAQIDQLVRFDDSGALTEREISREALTRAVLERLEAARTTTVSTATLMALGLLAILTFFTAGILGRRSAARLEAVHTALIRSHQDTKRANDALMQFTGIAAHDLAKPIRHVQFFCELIGDEPGNAEHTLAQTAEIERVTSNMQKLITRLLEFTKDGFQTVRPTLVNTQRLVESVVDTMQLEIESNNASVSVGDLAPCQADPELLRQVFSNLIGNSLKYARPDTSPRVSVSSESVDGWVEFSVSDNGIGIDPRYAEQIFKPMQRLHGPQSEFEGFGLGLSLVQAIVEGHSGSIRLDDDFEGGARFVFRLPHQAAQASARKKLSPVGSQ